MGVRWLRASRARAARSCAARLPPLPVCLFCLSSIITLPMPAAFCTLPPAYLPRWHLILLHLSPTRARLLPACRLPPTACLPATMPITPYNLRSSFYLCASCSLLPRASACSYRLLHIILRSLYYYSLYTSSPSLCLIPLLLLRFHWRDGGAAQRWRRWAKKAKRREGGRGKRRGWRFDKSNRRGRLSLACAARLTAPACCCCCMHMPVT